MKKDFTNRKVVNSIGIGFLAMITSGTPVLAALNNAMNENEAADQTMETDLPTDAAAATQNAEIMDVLTGTQEVIQNVQDELNPHRILRSIFGDPSIRRNRYLLYLSMQGTQSVLQAQNLVGNPFRRLLAGSKDAQRNLFLVFRKLDHYLA